MLAGYLAMKTGIAMKEYAGAGKHSEVIRVN